MSTLRRGDQPRLPPWQQGGKVNLGGEESGGKGEREEEEERSPLQVRGFYFVQNEPNPHKNIYLSLPLIYCLDNSDHFCTMSIQFAPRLNSTEEEKGEYTMRTKGRPKGTVKNDKMEAVYIRLSPEEIADYKRAAKTEDRSLSSYLRLKLKEVHAKIAA